MKHVLIFVWALVSAVLASIYGLGLSYEADLTPRSTTEVFDGIYKDGWLVDDAKLNFKSLAPRGNKLLIRFSDWHPGDRPVPHLQAYLCGQLVSEFQLTPDQKLQEIYLTGECQPREVSFKVLNPFVASETDTRALGAQVEWMKLKSKLGVPIVNFELVTIVAAYIFLLSIFVAYSSSHKVSQLLSMVTPLIGFWLLAASPNLDFTLVAWVWLVFCCVAAGSLVGRLADSEEKPTTPIATVVVLLVVGLAALLRFYQLDFGLPLNFHPDEVPKFNAVMRMRQAGDLNPRYFLHPSFLLYSSYAMNVVLQYLGDFASFEETLTFAGRLVSATAGTLSVYVVYRIALLLWSPLAAIYSALFFAVFPLHVTCSRYVKEDVLLTFVILLSVWAFVKAVTQSRKSLLLLSGFLAGVACSTKYSGLLCVGYLMTAPFLVSSKLYKPDQRWILPTIIALILLPVGFILVTPYSVMDAATFIRDFSHEENHMMRGHSIMIDAWSQRWMYHIVRSIVPGISVPVFLASLIGIGLALGRKPKIGLLLLGFVLVFYLPAEWVKAKPAPQPERYIVPCLPFLAMAIGILLAKLQAAVRPVLVTILMLLFLFFPAERSIKLALDIEPDTREIMANWMKSNIPAGSKVYIDWRPYAPQFPNGEFQLEFLPRSKIIPSLALDQLRERGDGYLVLSSLYYARYFTQPKTNPAIRESLREVFRKVPIVKQIVPKEGTYGFHNPSLTIFSLFPQDFAVLDQEIQARKQGSVALTSNERRCIDRSIKSLCTAPV